MERYDESLQRQLTPLFHNMLGEFSEEVRTIEETRRSLEAQRSALQAAQATRESEERRFTEVCCAPRSVRFFVSFELTFRFWMLAWPLYNCWSSIARSGSHWKRLRIKPTL